MRVDSALWGLCGLRHTGEKQLTTKRAAVDGPMSLGWCVGPPPLWFLPLAAPSQSCFQSCR